MSGHYQGTFIAVKTPVLCVIEAGFVKFAYISLRGSCTVLTDVNVTFGRSAILQV